MNGTCLITIIIEYNSNNCEIALNQFLDKKNFLKIWLYLNHNEKYDDLIIVYKCNNYSKFKNYSDILIFILFLLIINKTHYFINTNVKTNSYIFVANNKN